MKKKVLATIMMACMVLGLTACGAKETKDEADYTIGICNYVDDASLNQIVENIEAEIDALESQYNVTIDVEYDNCNADANVLNQIITKFVSDDVDLMIGVATPVAMAMQAATEDNQIPVVFAAVSDPVGAGLVASLDAPGANITGTSDALNTESIINLMELTDPSIKKVALLYDLGQDSSTQAIKDAKAALEAKGIEYVEETATSVDEAVIAAQDIVKDSDIKAVFTPTDNTIMQAELSIYETFRDAGVLHFTGADSFALNGAFFGYGVNYADLGKSTADLAVDILVNSKNPAETPVVTFDNGIATVNTDICDAVGIDITALKESYAPYASVVNEIKTAESFE